MKLITDDLIDAVARDIAKGCGEPDNVAWFRAPACDAVRSVAPLIVRRCLRHIDAHHDDFIDGHNDKEYFEIVDEILIKVKVALRELIEETN